MPGSLWGRLLVAIIRSNFGPARGDGRSYLPRQNRPLVRDGRIQPKKKRTDRSYLRSRPEPVPVEPEAPATEDEAAPDEDQLDASTAAEVASVEELAADAGRPPVAAPAKVPGSVRAIQKQGVRRRREVDVRAILTRDTQYALHEIRRILILATIVIVTLIVLGFALR
jgi:hypothetical protein